LVKALLEKEVLDAKEIEKILGKSPKNSPSFKNSTTSEKEQQTKETNRPKNV